MQFEASKSEELFVFLWQLFYVKCDLRSYLLYTFQLSQIHSDHLQSAPNTDTRELLTRLSLFAGRSVLTDLFVDTEQPFQWSHQKVGCSEEERANRSCL